jgi:hypothetical protein
MRNILGGIRNPPSSGNITHADKATRRVELNLPWPKTGNRIAKLLLTLV